MTTPNINLVYPPPRNIDDPIYNWENFVPLDGGRGRFGPTGAGFTGPTGPTGATGATGSGSSIVGGSWVGVTDGSGIATIPHGLGYTPNVMVCMTGDLSAVANRNLVYGILAMDATNAYIKAGISSQPTLALTNTLMRISYFVV